MKRIAAAAGLLILLCSMAGIYPQGTSGIYGWFTDVDQADNKLSVGRNDVTIEENFPDPEPDPGKEMKKEVSFRNTGNVACYVRACYLFDSDQAEKETIVKMGSEGWQMGDDGYYYYAVPIIPEETTTPFLTAVKISDTAELESFDLTIYTETVHSEGFSSPQEAFSHLKR